MAFRMFFLFWGDMSWFYLNTFYSILTFLHFNTIIYIYIYIYIYINIFTKCFFAPCFSCNFFQSFSEKLNQKFVNIPHAKWMKNNGIPRRSWSARHYIYRYSKDVSVKQLQYHIVWNYQHLYFEIYDFFISAVYKIYVCPNKQKYISLPRRRFSHFCIGCFDWRSIFLLHILEQ